MGAMPPDSFHIFAPAKINLFLHITGKREDGYHMLQSLMAFADIGDDLEFSAHNDFEVNIGGPFAGSLPESKDNLIYKAARILSNEYGVPLCGKISLAKNLPIASGIGGGSADAAAALKGLVKLWNLPDDPLRLQKIALQLGTDVPACLYGRPVWAEGIGDILSPIADMLPLHLVLINPLVATSTPEVFKNFWGEFSAPIKKDSSSLAIIQECRNDLTQAAITVTPQINDVLAALEKTQQCLLHRLSGSGATCFGIYEDEGAAKEAATSLKKKYPAWWIQPANIG
jgi:4-diphosphocytidyl-2-C-methyl-D-erythritol kinase